MPCAMYCVCTLEMRVVTLMSVDEGRCWASRVGSSTNKASLRRLLAHYSVARRGKPATLALPRRALGSKGSD